MARTVRIEYAGGFYHVMARGNRRGPIFLDDDDRKFFLKALSEACGRTGWRVHAWVLMGNHYHLFLETPEPNLVDGMKWLQNTFTRRFNIRHGEWGRLFGDRYKSVLVEGKTAGYYETLLDYIHLNPARAGLVRCGEGQSVADYPWSSLAGGYLLSPKNRPKWLAAEVGLSVLGLKDSVNGRRQFVERLDRRAMDEGKQCGVPPSDSEADARMSNLRRGWYWGTSQFAETVLKMGEKAITKGKSRAYSRTKERRAHGQSQAEELIKAGLKAAATTEKWLTDTKGSDPGKVAIAKLIWEKTTVTQTWIADRLQMASAANVSRTLHKWRWPDLSRRLGKGLRRFIQGEIAH